MKTYPLIFATVFVSIVSIYFSSSQLLYLPLPWSDEAIYHQMVQTHHQTGAFGIPMWKDLLLETETHNYWYPPFFFSALSLYARFVDLTIVSQRQLSMFLATIAAVFFLFLSREYIKSKYYFLPILIMLTDFIWLRGSRMSRPESLILTLGAISLVLLHLFVMHKKKYWLGLAVVTASLSLLSHYYGLWVSIAGFLFLWFYSKANYKKQAVIFGILTLIPLFLWWLQLYPHWNVLYDHTFLGVENKVSIEPITFLANKTNTLPLKIQYSLLQAAGLISIIIVWSKKKARWIAASLGIIWLMILVGRMFWYVVYIIPFTYLLWAIAYEHIHQKHIKLIWKFVGLVIVVLNLTIWYTSVSNETSSNYAYTKLVKSVAETIPADATVFLTAEPETYYGFVEYNPSVNLLMYPAVSTSKEAYKKVLDRADYVIFTGDYVSRLFGNFLPNYLEKNTAEYRIVGQDYGQAVTIIKLTPSEMRQ